MKVFIMTDLEAVAGVSSFLEHTYPDAKYYDECKKLLTAEVNAAVDGLLEAGAEDVLVLDGHGPGGMWFQDLHLEARLIHGRPLDPKWIDLLEDRDVAIFIGQHAMAGVQDGNLNHTMSSLNVDYYKLNGELIGEIAHFALLAGSYGVPTIYLSGDEAACREIEELIPGVTTTAVKQGLSRNSTISVSAARAHQLIRDGVKQAVANHAKDPVAPLVWDGPFELDKRFFQSDMADDYAKRRGIERVDSQTIRIRSDDIRDVLYRH